MEDKIEEGLIKGSIDIITIDKTEKILKQMKESICKIDDDYDYYSNKKNIINDINEKDENHKIDKSNVEMASTFGI